MISWMSLGSGELSSYTPALQELTPPPAVFLSSADAEQLGVQTGGCISLEAEGKVYTLPLEVKEELTRGVVMVSAGLPGAPVLNWGGWVKLDKAT